MVENKYFSKTMKSDHPQRVYNALKDEEHRGVDEQLSEMQGKAGATVLGSRLTFYTEFSAHFYLLNLVCF